MLDLWRRSVILIRLDALLALEVPCAMPKRHYEMPEYGEIC